MDVAVVLPTIQFTRCLRHLTPLLGVGEARVGQLAFRFLPQAVQPCVRKRVARAILAAIAVVVGVTGIDDVVRHAVSPWSGEAARCAAPQCCI